MKNKKLSVRFLTESAVIAALYAAATYLSAAFSLAYGPVQFRLSEALTVLSTLTPAAIPGLTIGCIIGNISSPMGIWDVLFGSAATLLGAVTGRMLRNVQIKKLPVLSSLMPVIFNAVIVGLEIVMPDPGRGRQAHSIRHIRSGSRSGRTRSLPRARTAALFGTQAYEAFQVTFSCGCCYIAIPLYGRKGRQQ